MLQPGRIILHSTSTDNKRKKFICDNGQEVRSKWFAELPALLKTAFFHKSKAEMTERVLNHDTAVIIDDA